MSENVIAPEASSTVTGALLEGSILSKKAQISILLSSKDVLPSEILKVPLCIKPRNQKRSIFKFSKLTPEAKRIFRIRFAILCAKLKATSGEPFLLEACAQRKSKLFCFDCSLVSALIAVTPPTMFQG